MEINTKRLKISIVFIDVALICIAISIILTFKYIAPHIGGFLRLSDHSSIKKGLKIGINLLPYFSMFVVLIPRLIFGVILFSIRKMVKSILLVGVFQLKHANKIRKIAVLFLCIATILFFFNGLVVIEAFAKGNQLKLTQSVLHLLEIFEKYIVTSLILFAVAEVFVAGAKLKKEQDLTI